MTKIKMITTAAIAALALSTASLAPESGFRGGHGHGGTSDEPRHHGWSWSFRPCHFGHGLFGHGYPIISSLITAAGNGALRPVNVCYRDY